MKLSVYVLVGVLSLFLPSIQAQNETLTNNLMSALFAFVEGNHEDMSSEMIDQLNQVQQGLADQADTLDGIEDHIDEIEAMAVGEGTLSCHGVVANGHCFILHNQRYNIHTANETCMGKDEHLAEIFTQHEYETVLDYLLSSDAITDRALIYVWTSMNVQGFGEPQRAPSQGNPDGPAVTSLRHFEEEFFYRQWVPSYPRRNPNFAYVAWQVVSNPVFADSGFINVPQDATAYPLCQYHLPGHEQKPIYVDVEMTLDMEFDEAMSDSTSQQYQDTAMMATDIAAAILNYTDAKVDFDEMFWTFSPGSVVCTAHNVAMHNVDSSDDIQEFLQNFDVSMIPNLMALAVAPAGPDPTDGPEPTDGPKPTDGPEPTDAPNTTNRPDTTGGPEPTELPTSTVEPSTTGPKQCGGQISGPSGNLTSPNFPYNYEDNHDCEWQIFVHPGETMEITFAEFGVEDDSNCEYDYVSIYDGPGQDSEWFSTFCGFTPPQPIFSTGNAVTIHFVSDSSINHAGWMLLWTTVSEQASTTTTTTTSTTIPPTTTTTTTPTTTTTTETPWQCGQIQPRKAKGTAKSSANKIAGRREAESGDFPWQAGYATGDSYIGVWQIKCGGTLIAERWVVTSAHCTHGNAVDGTGSRVFLGAGELVMWDGSTNGEFDVTLIIEHPDYDNDAATNDIALLKLGRPAVYNDNIQPACLPAQGQDPMIGQECLASGWGTLQEGGPTPNMLQVVSMPIISNQQCAEWNNAAILDNMICAGIAEGGVGTCQGDRGGPLVCGDSAGYTLHGVTSWGSGCARPEQPDVYTRMADFVDWTIQNMQDNHEDPGLFGLPMTECGAVISNDQIIRLPVTQNVYLNDWSCSWTISPPTGAIGMEVTFLHKFWLEKVRYTCYDKLFFILNQGEDIREFCGDTLPGVQYYHLRGDSDSFLVRFNADDEYNGVGFAFRITFDFE